MTRIGLDLSINSTGVCVNVDGVCDYYIIASKLTKKQLEFSHSHVHLIQYDKQQPEGEYTEKERIKTLNIDHIVTWIYRILSNYDCDVVNIEGISFGSTGSAALIDLSGLNYMVRKMLIDNNISFNIISPTQNKKFATGNGSAEKDVMIDAWKRLDRSISDITTIKIDDLADAYFLSCYSE